MKIFVQALVIFFGTLLVAALVALGRPAQGTQDAYAAPEMLARQAGSVAPLILHRWVAPVAAA